MKQHDIRNTIIECGIVIGTVGITIETSLKFSHNDRNEQEGNGENNREKY
jgi:hypothetical protein